ncbi:endonuclease/exonuclease/phosphatase family protein [Actinoplanes sp. NEAU-A12]|uniref:Endonuclease/exonuclease/phosphatase family protein n=1 Tax=Actinoplanes sandaracinus TaxID=3045177 RepID=A0ABT6WI26_9ACTN|nr:endonuclease/exonuclease/phosphatase family protein [Actinoplanes sandaracinus]MDI6099386.1 endonuclease/exonuclease/phosphatase family protein [Actinoplanes sandaracinus]
MTLLEASSPVVAEPVAPARRRSGLTVLGLAVLWLGYVLAHELLSGRVWWMLLPDLAPPFVFALIPALLLGGAAIVRGRHGGRAALLAVVAFALTAGQSGLRLPALGSPGPVPAGAIRVVSWNTQFWEQDEDPQAFYRYLRSYDADVYLLQEYLYFTDGPIRIDRLAEVRQWFPGYQIVADSELLTLSRLPIRDSRPLAAVDDAAPPPAGTDFLSYWTTKTLRTDIEVGGGVISFYNVHTPVQLDAERSPLTTRFYTVVQDQAARREASWRALTTDLDGNPGPVFVAGDFNSTPAMGELDRIRLDEAALTGGGLYPSTWDARGRGWWRLDHVFTSDDVAVHRYDLHDSLDLSDHRAQDLRISLT